MRLRLRAASCGDGTLLPDGIDTSFEVRGCVRQRQWGVCADSVDCLTQRETLTSPMVVHLGECQRIGRRAMQQCVRVHSCKDAEFNKPNELLW